MNNMVTRPLTDIPAIKNHLIGKQLPTTELRDYCVDAEVLQALKELGFDHKDQFVIYRGESSRLPLMDEVIDWLHDKFKILVYTTPHTNGTFFFHVDCHEKSISIKLNSIPTRREATLRGILRAIEVAQTLFQPNKRSL